MTSTAAGNTPDLSTNAGQPGTADAPHPNRQRAAAAAAADAPAAPKQQLFEHQEADSMQQERPQGPRKLLVILHGKRIDDDQVRHAIQVCACVCLCLCEWRCR
jgi:hypothetical protein